MSECYRIADFLGTNVVSLEKKRDISVISAHSHEFIEMIYLCTGKAVHRLDGKTESMKGGDYVFIDCGKVHGFTEKSEDFCAVTCLFIPEFTDTSLRGCHSISDILKDPSIGLYSAEYAGTVFHDFGGKIGNELDFMLSEFAERKPGYIQMIRGSLARILIYSARSIGAEVFGADPIVKRIVDYTNENPAENRTLTYLSWELRYSVSRLSTLFRQTVGIPYSEYLRQTRIHMSCSLLARQNSSIEEIAEQVGYSDVRAFRRNFKMITGTTPIRYRNTYRGNK